MPVSLSVGRADLGALDTPLLVVALGAQPAAAALDDALRPLDAALGGALGRSIERRDFRGGRDETLHLAGGAKGAQRVLQQTRPGVLYNDLNACNAYQNALAAAAELNV